MDDVKQMTGSEATSSLWEPQRGERGWICEGCAEEWERLEKVPIEGEPTFIFLCPDCVELMEDCL